MFYHLVSTTGLVSKSTTALLGIKGIHDLDTSTFISQQLKFPNNNLEILKIPAG